MILPPHNKDCAVFGETINGKYYALHRPSSPELGGNYMWIAESPDMIHWGNHRCIAHSRKGMWDSARIGAGGAPIPTDRGMVGNLSRRNRPPNSLLSRRDVVGSQRPLTSLGAFVGADHGTDRGL